MSISDCIVVMKDGVVQQTGKPPEVYDQPANLFVAKFLGTPPINVFRGSVRDGKLYIGDAGVLDVSAPNGEVFVGVRPEGFVPDANGALACQLERVEVMGRDHSVVVTHEASENTSVRAILSADASVDISSAEVRFALKANKVFLFDAETEERIYG